MSNEAPSRDGDRLIGFTLPDHSARGRLLRLDSALGLILEAHAYSEIFGRLLGEALALTALLGDLLRPDDGQVTLQARGDGGPCQLLVADYRQGELRGYAAQDLDRRFDPADDKTPSLRDMFGEGQLVITLDQTVAAERYQGIVELGSTSLEDAARDYFINSEQVSTVIRLAAARGEDGRWTAGGFILQSLPRSEVQGERLHLQSDEASWQHVSILAQTLTDAELVDASLPLETLLWRLFHEEQVRVLPERSLSRGCRCSTSHIESVLKQFPESERSEMRNAQGVIAVDCEFCSRQFLLEV